MKKLVLLLVLAIICFNQIGFADIEVHFLDVGQGDSAVVICDDQIAMIDGGSADKSDYVFSYLRNTLQLNHIDYLIATHPHEDHIGGLSAALNACSVGKILSPVFEYESEEFHALLKYADKQGLVFDAPNIGESFNIGGATATVLSSAIDSGNENDMSIVLRIEYGNTSFLFMGDAEIGAENILINSDFAINSNVLKVGHHGSETSSSRDFLSAVMPQISIISVGAGNQYDHPSAWVISDLNMLDSEIYRTDLHGTISVQSDGNTIEVKTEKDRPFKVLKHQQSDLINDVFGYSFVGNKNSKKFHHSYCESVNDMSDKNKIDFSDRETAISNGYVPCKNCDP